MRLDGGDWRAGAAWWLFWAVASSAWCVTAGPRLGATFDEPLYVAEGLKCWRTGSHAGLLRWGTMPLPADAQTFPLYLAERWTGMPWDLSRDWPCVLHAMRLGNLPFWWLLLAYAGVLGHSVAGRWGGRLAVALCACEPNLLAHASLATTDIAITACMLAFVHHWRAGRDGPWAARIALPGICYGVALAAKASALAFLPVLMLALELDRYARARLAGNAPTLVTAGWRFVLDSVQVGTLGLGLVFVLCGTDWRPEAGIAAWAAKLPPGDLHDRAVWLVDSIRIFPNAGEGLVRQIKHNMRGHGMFLLGESHPAAVWYYFPVVLSLKVPAALFAAAAGVLLVRPRAFANAALVAALALFLFSFNCRVQIGVRLLLPCVAFGVVGLAGALAETAAHAHTLWLRRATAGIAAGAAAWLAAISGSAWPDGLRYVNELWGGPEKGYEIVSDSNYDWGQGVPGLADFARRRGLGDLEVWYFGTDPDVDRPPLRQVKLHLLPVACGDDVRAQVRGRYLAAGTSVVYGCGLTDAHRAAQAYLRTLTPVARTSTFLVYDLRPEGTP